MMRKTDYQRFEKLAENGVIVPVFQELPADMRPSPCWSASSTMKTSA